ncbi:MAG: hypothetical protein R8G34_12795 [Paracoccaceae bacterium]|nr:hypothetical protein [Paracoccaceae bacterium]
MALFPIADVDVSLPAVVSSVLDATIAGVPLHGSGRSDMANASFCMLSLSHAITGKGVSAFFAAQTNHTVPWTTRCRGRGS